MTAGAPSASGTVLADRLAGVRVGLRRDLEFSRHLFHGEPSYIVRDPITFRSQRLDRADYHIMVAIRPELTLGEIFAELEGTGRLSKSDREPFYQFVFDLHRLGFLQLPISDSSALYGRYESRRRTAARSRLRSLFYLRIPVWNPDGFLNHTMRLAAPVFHPAFVLSWVSLMIAAICVLFGRWHTLHAPLQALWAADNLPLIWATLIALKLFHEFGHAYACKHFGGHVPEMGIMLILFTPCAYVDATASWGFSSKWKRLVVCFAGMYIESIFAAIAVFVWASTEPSLLHSLAYNVMFLASVTTILFNINPLMRYDGYYILSDWLEIPNLRSRSEAWLAHLAKRFLLGLNTSMPVANRRVAVALTTYGLLALLYRSLLIVAIAVALASKMFLLGLAIGVTMSGAALIRTVRNLYRYLWHAEETAAVRRRAVAWGVLALAGVPTAAAFIPIPTSVQTEAVVAFAEEYVIRAPSAGFLESDAIEAGDRVATGQTLAILSSEDLVETQLLAEADVQAATARLYALTGTSPVQAGEEAQRLAVARETLRVSRDRLQRLSITSPIDGSVVDHWMQLKAGTFVPVGTPLFTICGGTTVLRTAIPQSAFAAVAPAEGDHIVFRPASLPQSRFLGTITRVVPQANRRGAVKALAAGWETLQPRHLDPGPVFEVEITLDTTDSPLRYGMTGVVQFEAEPQTLLQSGVRNSWRFVQKLLAAN